MLLAVGVGDKAGVLMICAIIDQDRAHSFLAPLSWRGVWVMQDDWSSQQQEAETSCSCCRNTPPVVSVGNLARKKGTNPTSTDDPSQY